MSRGFRARPWLGVLLALGASAALLGCGGSGDAGDARLSAEARLGEKIFSDVSLSASGRQSCATCHDAARGHAANNALPAQLGGPDGTLQGVRNTPGIRYLASNTPFFFDEEGTPTGGFFWDGRAATLAEQAAGPFLNPLEMANPDKASVITKLAAAPYAAEFRRVYGDAIFSDVEGAYQRLTEALQRYQLEDVEFNAFTSKYDAYLRGTAQLSAQEARGLALFNEPTKGNCAACHPSAPGAQGALPLFTDFTYDNLGLPRNPALRANDDRPTTTWGLCHAPIWPGATTCAAPSRCPRCATWRCARRCSTTVCSPRSGTRCASTCCATPSPSCGIRAAPTAASTSSTTCRPTTTPASTPAKRPTTASRATRRPSTTPRSTTWWPSCGR